jgi:hypothetical protein
MFDYGDPFTLKHLYTLFSNYRDSTWEFNFTYLHTLKCCAEHKWRYKACSKKDRTFVIKTLFYNILSTIPFKVFPSTGDTTFLTFLLLLQCFLEHTFCDGVQLSYRIFLNLRVLKKPNFLNSAPSVLVGGLFKKFGLFFEHWCSSSN